MKRKVAVTGLGIISPVGNDVATFWASLVAGKSGVGPVTRFDASRLDSRIAAEVKDFDSTLYMDKKDARKMALFSQFAVAAAVQAWRDAGFGDHAAAGEKVLGLYSPDRISTVIGNGIGGLEIFQESYKKLLEAGPGRMLPMTVPLMIINEASANIAMRLGITGAAYTQATACASGTDAIGQALDLIRAGRCDVALAGGTEAAVTEFAMGGFCRLQALSTARNDDPQKASRPFDRDRDGFVMGEGSAILVLEDYEAAKARGAHIYAELAGYGATCDAYHLTSPDPEGTGGARAIGLALADAGLERSEVGYYNAHGTSTTLNDQFESGMIKKAFLEFAKTLKISSTKSMTGHCVAAAGAVEAVVCIKAIQEGILPPTINLDNPDIAAGCDLDYIPNKSIRMDIDAAVSTSLGFGGHNGVLAFRKAR